MTYCVSRRFVSLSDVAARPMRGTPFRRLCQPHFANDRRKASIDSAPGFRCSGPRADHRGNRQSAQRTVPAEIVPAENQSKARCACHTTTGRPWCGTPPGKPKPWFAPRWAVGRSPRVRVTLIESVAANGPQLTCCDVCTPPANATPSCPVRTPFLVRWRVH